MASNTSLEPVRARPRLIKPGRDSVVAERLRLLALDGQNHQRSGFVSRARQHQKVGLRASAAVAELDAMLGQSYERR
jgi:hypothetical protein